MVMVPDPLPWISDILVSWTTASQYSHNPIVWGAAATTCFVTYVNEFNPVTVILNVPAYRSPALPNLLSYSLLNPVILIASPVI